MLHARVRHVRHLQSDSLPPPADQLTWQHSFKGGQACKNEPSKALLTPTEAPVRSTPRAARPPPLWKRQGHNRAPRSLQSPHASLSARDGAFLAPPGPCADPACAHGRAPWSPPPSQALPRAGQRHDPSPAGWTGRMGGQRRPNTPVLSGPLLPNLRRNLSRVPQEDGRFQDILQQMFCLFASVMTHRVPPTLVEGSFTRGPLS